MPSSIPRVISAITGPANSVPSTSPGRRIRDLLRTNSRHRSSQWGMTWNDHTASNANCCGCWRSTIDWPSMICATGSASPSLRPSQPGEPVGRRRRRRAAATRGGFGRHCGTSNQRGSPAARSCRARRGLDPSAPARATLRRPARRSRPPRWSAPQAGPRVRHREAMFRIPPWWSPSSGRNASPRTTRRRPLPHPPRSSTYAQCSPAASALTADERPGSAGLRSLAGMRAG